MSSINLDTRFNDTFIFTPTDGTTFQSFTIPNKVKMVSFIIIGAGGGGGGGSQPSGADATYTGGGGGGSGQIITATIPSIYLPETLYFYLGKGGDGGARAVTTGASGSNGQFSYVLTRPELVVSNMIIEAGRGIGGQGGSTGARLGGSFTGGGVYIAMPSIFLNISAGRDGGAGNSSTPSSSVQILNQSIVTGGAGGGGCTGASAAGFEGQGLTGNYKIKSIPGGTAGGGNGNPGLWDWDNMFGCGGSGGGGSPNASGTTGNGGDGAYGCGGGGGGSSRRAGAGAGGQGGKGGDGIAIISVW